MSLITLFPLLGFVRIAEKNGALVSCTLVSPEIAREHESACIGTRRETALECAAAVQLAEYLEGRRTAFDLPLSPQGTEFQRCVWTVLCGIDYRCVISYKEVASRCGNSRAARAVGMANHANPLPIFIPCHRVIAADGSPGGYGLGVALKLRLLALESGR